MNTPATPQEKEVEYAIEPDGTILPISPLRSEAFYEGHDLVPCDGRVIPDGEQWDKLRKFMSNSWYVTSKPGCVPDLRGVEGKPYNLRGPRVDPKCTCGLWACQPGRRDGHSSWCEIKE